MIRWGVGVKDYVRLRKMGNRGSSTKQGEKLFLLIRLMTLLGLSINDYVRLRKMKNGGSSIKRDKKLFLSFMMRFTPSTKD